MLRTKMALLFLALFMALPVTASAAPPQQTMTVRATPATQTTPLPVLGFSILGAAMAMAATKKMDLTQTYLFEGDSYGPGKDVEVPEGFPELDVEGMPIHPEGSPAARNAARAKSFSTAPNSGGVFTGESKAEAGVLTLSGKSEAELNTMKVDELDALAVELGVPVSRGDGQAGDPLKGDYVKALSAAR